MSAFLYDQSGSFGTVTTETNGFLVNFNGQMGEFAIRTQTAFQGILQTIQSAANSIPSIMPSFSFGGSGSGAGSGSGGFEYNSSTGYNWWNSLPSFSGGGAISSDGVITGPGTGTSDSILARVGNGEGILNVEAMKMLGLNFLRRANSGDIYNLRIPVPKFATGGYVGNAGAAAAGQGMAAFSQNIGTNVSTKANVNVTVVRNEADALAQTLGTREGANVMVNWVKGSGTLLSHIFDLSRRGR